MDELERLVGVGRLIPVRLESLPVLESELQAAKLWRERTARTFLRKNSSYTLMEALSPRTATEIANHYAGKTRRHHQASPGPILIINANIDPIHVVDAFK